MSHTITAKLNKPARKHIGQNGGATFFVSLGEKNYNRKTQQNEWTNYECALFAKDNQIQFYESALVQNAVVGVTGTGIIIDNSNPEYPAKLMLLDSRLEFVSGGAQSAPQQALARQSGYQQPVQQQPPQQSAPQPAQQGTGFSDFDDDIAF